jgi:hypothetical protein
MLEIFPFQFEILPSQIAGTALWSLACYWAFSPVNDWILLGLQRWFNFAERSLYISQEEFDRTRLGRESQNAFFASMVGILPFLAVGALLNYGVDRSLEDGWSLSLGIIACIGGGIYELGRRQTEE